MLSEKTLWRGVRKILLQQKRTRRPKNKEDIPGNETVFRYQNLFTLFGTRRHRHCVLKNNKDVRCELAATSPLPAVEVVTL
jgi:hypothetical protein